MMKFKISIILMALAVLGVGCLITSCGSDSVSGTMGGGQLGSKVIASQRDTDGDGIIDIRDADDDNDGLLDSDDPDDDNDGIPDDEEEDADDDGIIDDHDDDFMELHGFIESKSGSTLVVFSTNVYVSDSTRIEGEGDVTLNLNDLVIGMWVEVHGIVNDDGSVDATEIEVKAREEDEEEGEDDESSSDSLSLGEL